MQLLLDADPPVLVTKLVNPATRQATFEFHAQNDTGSTTRTMVVICGHPISDAEYRALGMAVAAVLR